MKKDFFDNALDDCVTRRYTWRVFLVGFFAFSFLFWPIFLGVYIGIRDGGFL